MTENTRFVFERSDYDLKYEFRVADTSKVKKTKEDFWNEEEEIYEYRKYIDYLWENDAFLTLEEADELLNALHEKSEQLKQKIISLEDARYSYKQDWKQASADCELYKNEIKFLKDENKALKKENEQLQKENQSWLKTTSHFDNIAYKDRDYAERMHKENEQLKQKIEELEELIDLIAYADSFPAEESVKETIRHKIRGLDSVAEEFAGAWNNYVLLSKFFKEYYKEEWDNYD